MGRIRIDSEVSLFFELLYVGLWNGKATASNFCMLSADKWESIHRMARCQTVTAIVFSGICTLPDEYAPKFSDLAVWAAEVDAIERRDAKMAAAQDRLLAFFHDRGLKPVVMKGRSVARFYPDPSLRESGDIDLYFRGDTFEAAVRALNEEGIEPVPESDGSVTYLWEGIVVEHHPRLLDISNPFKRRQLRELEDRYGADSPMMTLLLLNTHILKHILGKGIGLRQFCDMALAWNALSPGLADGEYEAACRSLGISGWTVLLHDFMNANAAHDRLLSIVLEGGNFGRHSPQTSTFAAFLSNFSFAMKIAPVEYLSLIAELAYGRLRRLIKLRR